MEFVNRHRELKSLTEQYDYEESSFVIIYGRRRLGKTSLIHQFLRSYKNSFYFMADNEHDGLQMNKLKTVFSSRFNDTFLNETSFDSWDKVFDYFISRADFSSKVILAIDEFQNLAIVNSSFTSVLQRIWDLKLKSKNIMLILCGSHVSMMYSTTLDYKSPLYGRRTADIKLQPIQFNSWNEFFKNDISARELVEFYAITSGIPKYIELLNKKQRPIKNIEKFMVSKDSFFYSEPRFILSQEIHDTTYYFSILRAISMGEHKLGNIAGVIGIPGQRITQYLDILRDLEIIERRVPITESNPEKSRKGLYFIKDYFIRFWFRFIYPWQSYLEMEDTAFVMEQIENGLNEFVSLVFEDIARQIIVNYSPFPLNHIGAFWSKTTEIDIVGYNDETQSYIFGECKWTNNKMSHRELRQLYAKTAQVKWPTEVKKEYFILFSKRGFTEDLEKIAEIQDTIILVDFSK